MPYFLIIEKESVALVATTTAYRTQMGLMGCYQSDHRYRKTPRNSVDSRHFRHFGTDSHCIKHCVLIDPCMGSGHILIAMFDVLMDIYESAGYDKREAAFEIVEHNIHGLDIDQRAYQLAYFAVMMKGRGYNRRFLRGRDGKPEPKVYAIVESNEINRNHLQFFGTHLSEMERNLVVMQIEGLLDTFKDAREYGSILNVDECDWELLEKFVEDLNADGQISFESFGSDETLEQLRKLVRVAHNLGQKYDAVVTNPPYMGASGMGAKKTLISLQMH